MPFLLYMTLTYLVHAHAVAAGAAQGHRASAMLDVFLRPAPGRVRFGLPVIKVAWLGIEALLYPLRKRYAALKARSRAWWLSYL